jgi:hypothetical protein
MEGFDLFILDWSPTIGFWLIIVKIDVAGQRMTCFFPLIFCKPMLVLMLGIMSSQIMTA